MEKRNVIEKGRTPDKNIKEAELDEKQAESIDFDLTRELSNNKKEHRDEISRLQK